MGSVGHSLGINIIPDYMQEKSEQFQKFQEFMNNEYKKREYQDYLRLKAKFEK